MLLQYIIQKYDSVKAFYKNIDSKYKYNEYFELHHTFRLP
jgi:hypothetical protein